ncbi:unnamed protein product [Microthlaspi erraticum]|uniref:Uncharacterized protein n=1 Tax=Microthlaspi erraticum TaxID=1685480 RepID=A0A6D2ITW7_9BRAS|nr:unnamed protein product [Microthlaspi erraticum]
MAENGLCAWWPSRSKHRRELTLISRPILLILDQYSQFLSYVASPLMAEALAIRETPLQAHTHGWINISLKPDSQTLIRAILSVEQIVVH